MYDDLSRIERVYGCVAEYNRSRWEDEEHEAELQEKSREYCKANKAKLEAAGDNAMYFCEDCFECKYYEDVGPTDIDSWGYQDDVPHGICHHKGGRKACKGTEVNSAGQFEVGARYTKVGFYGGVTTYIVEEIDREKGQILLSEEWYDVDGSGTRPAEWHTLKIAENGNEMALEWTSKEFGEVWIYA